MPSSECQSLADLVDEVFELAHLAYFASGLASNPTDIARKTLGQTDGEKLLNARTY